jgi:hypothetical protein
MQGRSRSAANRLRGGGAASGACGVFIGEWSACQGIRHAWRDSNYQFLFTVPAPTARRRRAFSRIVVCAVLIAVGEGGKSDSLIVDKNRVSEKRVRIRAVTRGGAW